MQENNDKPTELRSINCASLVQRVIDRDTEIRSKEELKEIILLGATFPTPFDVNWGNGEVFVHFVNAVFSFKKLKVLIN